MKFIKRLQELENYQNTFIGFKHYKDDSKHLWVFTLNLRFCILEISNLCATDLGLFGIGGYRFIINM